MPELIAQKTRIVIALFAVALYAFGALLGPAAASGFDHAPQSSCHLAMQQDGHAEAGAHHDGKDGATAPHGAFGHGGPDCHFSCSIAVIAGAAPALAQPDYSALSFVASAVTADDFRPEQLSPPPKTLA
ncbi:hypothetical protein [Methylocystis heyeri]|uniref:DUF2946 domain-containing protein n=1 Tax=Methylocystis heyeri TaxID=391905 RepID=A0A6B8KGA2_9HYPH|nr:hypothetical protein [Methylocystis heyeri]QGM45450.1 hypothetical protein H2LOC_006935 [Methylocystis heyeri]